MYDFYVTVMAIYTTCRFWMNLFRDLFLIKELTENPEETNLINCKIMGFFPKLKKDTFW